MILRQALVLAFAALTPGSLAHAAADDAGTYLITNVDVVTMADDRVLTGRQVLVDDGKIVAIEPAEAAPRPADVEVIDGRGRYLLPGIAEMHAHVPGPDQEPYAYDVLLLYVAHGVTTIRGMLGHRWHLELRERIDAHDVLGPRLFTAGPSFNGNSVPDVATAERMVREQHAAGYDFLKLHPGLTIATFDAVARTAAEVGISFQGHVSEAVGLAHALASGQRAIDHLDAYVTALADHECTRGRAAGFFGIGLTSCIDEQRIPELVARTVKTHAWNAPTQVLLEQWAQPPAASTLDARTELRYLPASVVERWREARRGFLSEQTVSAEEAAHFIAVRRRLIRELDAADAGVLLGSDAPQIFNVPGHSAIEELVLYVASGLTPYRALRTGTVNPARFFGAEQRFGRIEEGLDADLLLLAANPLEDVRALRRLEGVMLRGRWLPRAELDRRLAALAQRNAR